MNNNKLYNKVIEQLRNLLLQGKYSEALKIYIQNVRAFNDKPELRNIGGDILFRLGKSDEAILEYERCIEVYRKRQLFANAIAIGKKILRIASHSEHIYEILGDVYMEAGLVGEAIINYLEFAEKKRKIANHSQLDKIIRKIADIFGGENKILLQTLSVFPELQKEFNTFSKESKNLKQIQKRDIIEMIKRDSEYETFDRLVEMELFRSRRYVRPFSIFAIELLLSKSLKKNCLSMMEKLFGIIKNNLRTIDYIFLNTEGFFYGLLPETPSDGVFTLSDRLVSRLKDLCDDNMNVSMRWATYPKNGQNINELFESLKKGGQVYFQ